MKKKILGVLIAVVVLMCILTLAISAADDQIICQCGNITRGQILEAICRGAATVDGIKRRVGTGMGPCQGSRCAWEIEKLLEEYGHGAL